MEEASGLKVIRISGIVKDAKTEEPLVRATVYLKSYRTKTAYTNEQGRFVLEIETDKQQDTLTITNAGYQPYRNKIELKEEINVSVNIGKKATDRSKKDDELVKAALAGDQKAYGKLMARYRDSIFFMIQKMVNNRDDAEDLTIEAFGKAFSKLQNFRADYAFSTWLYRIAINNCIDFMRKKRLDVYSLDEPMSDGEGSSTSRDIPSMALDPEAAFMKGQRIELIQSVLSRLSPKYRQLIELRFLKELSYDEISTTMGLPLGTVKAQLHRAKELLRNILRNGLDNY